MYILCGRHFLFSLECDTRRTYLSRPTAAINPSGNRQTPVTQDATGTLYMLVGRRARIEPLTAPPLHTQTSILRPKNRKTAVPHSGR